jgi:hypothetical protein
MVDSIFHLMDRLAPLSKPKKPGRACLIGFLFGAIGIAIYFRSAVDFVFPLGVYVAVFLGASAMGIPVAGIGWLVASLVIGLYGYFRALSSNGKLEGSAGGASVQAA